MLNVVKLLVLKKKVRAVYLIYEIKVVILQPEIALYEQNS